MPRRWLQGQLPDPVRLRKQLGVADADNQSWVRRVLSEPMLWHLNRRSVAGGVAVGLFVSFLPMPLQMIVAAVLAAVMRVHVPVSVVMVWFSNPLTFAPLLYAAWSAGSMILGADSRFLPTSFALSELVGSATHAWPGLLVGSLFCASVAGVLGYFATHLIWRFSLTLRWRRRLARNAAHRNRHNSA